MRKYVEWIIRLRILVVVGIVVVTIVLGIAASRVRIDIDRKKQIPQNHPLIKIENQITGTFGGARFSGIAVMPKQGDIYDPAVLSAIQRMTESIEAMPGAIPSNILSIASRRAKAIQGAADGMDVRPLIEDVPSDAATLQALKKRIAGQPFYTPLLVSTDGKAALILADFYENADPALTNPAIHKTLMELADKERNASLEVVVAGMPIWLSYIDEFAREMPLYLFFAVIIIAVIHYEAFRTVQAMLLPLVTALLSVVWALGWLGLSGLPMDTWNAMTPILVLAVAAGHAVQILKRYYEEYERTNDNRLAVVESVTKVGGAMVLAGVMAAMGFASLALFNIRTVKVFGLVTAAGILSALIIEMTFIPAVRSMLPAPKPTNGKATKQSALDSLIEGIATIVLARPGTVLLIGGTITVLAVLGATQLVVNNSFMAAMPKGHPYRLAESAINKHFGGASSMNILVDANQLDGIKRPAVLKAISGLQEFLKKDPAVGATLTITDYVKRMNQAMHNDDPRQYRVPEDQSLIAQYLFLYSLSGGPDDFDMVVDKDYRKTVIRVFSKSDEHVFITELFKKTEQEAERLFPRDVTVSVAGGTLGVSAGLNETIVREKMMNVGQILLIIFFFSSLVFRSMIAGLYILVPSTLAMLVSLGVMGIFGIPLSLGTATTSALTVSIGADYALYVLYRMREEAGRGVDVETQVRRVLLSTGKAVFYVSSAIAAGYAILIFTGFLYYRQLGGLVSSSMILSSLAAVTLLPAMVLRFRPKFLRSRL